MTFVSLTFIVFLCIVFTLYWLWPNRTAQNVLLVGSSYIFYGWWDWRYLGLIIVSSLIDFFAGYALHRLTSRPARQAVLAVSIVTNLGLLGAFKYFNFFSQSFADLAAAFGWHVTPFFLDVMLPVGISFYTFQTMSYAIDVYQGKIPNSPGLIDYLAYVAFFPQLVAGPIERAPRLLVQMETPRVFSYGDAVDGCRQMLWGYMKKIVIADRLAVHVDRYYSHPEMSTGPELWVATFFFALQIYCDFAAYSDIAIGVAKLFGFQLMRNFAYPYFSKSVTEFWSRWHISLSTWFRDYVYIPMGGNRVSFRRGLLNVFVTFVISGLWHGAAWTFLLWGVVHGAYVCAERWWKNRQLFAADNREETIGPLPDIRTAAAIARTFFMVMIAWVFFRAQTVDDAFLILRKMVTEIWRPASYEGLLPLIGGNLFFCLCVFIVIEWLYRAKVHPLGLGRFPRSVRWAAYTALLWLCLYCCPDQQTAFIYFQF